MRLLGLDLSGKRVLVVGAGTVARRRVHDLNASGARVRIVAPNADDAVTSAIDAASLETVNREVVAADLDHCWLAIAATNDADVNAAVAQWAHERRVWCVQAGDAAGGSARMVAQQSWGDLVVGVGSLAEPDPRRTVAVRDALLELLDTGVVSTPRQRPTAGRVVLVGAGPGDPGLLTVAGRAALSSADVVVADRLGTAAHLATLGDHVTVIDVGKTPGTRSSQADINRVLIEQAQAGHTVVRLKGGDPFVFGRGGEEFHACVQAGVPCDVIPGISSALAVPALAGIPVTQRGITFQVMISSGHAGLTDTMVAAVKGDTTLVLLMAVAALPSIVAGLLDAGVDPDVPVAIVERGSTPDQRLTHAPLAQIVAEAEHVQVVNPAIVVVGAVAAPEVLSSAQCATPKED